MMNVPLALALVYAFSAGSDISRFPPKIVRCCAPQEQKAASLSKVSDGRGKEEKRREHRVHLHVLFSGLSINNISRGFIISCRGMNGVFMFH